MNDLENKCVALSALFMATEQIDTIAYQGNSNQHDVRTLIDSLFINDADDSAGIYGELDKLRNGFSKTATMLGNDGQQADSLEIMRYVISLIHLETQLRKNPDMGEQLIIELEAIKHRHSDKDILDPIILEELGELYQNTISALGPRIMIKGEQAYLEEPASVAKIRALLLSGIRAAVLWKQSGGNRFTLLLNRKALIVEAEKLLKSS